MMEVERHYPKPIEPILYVGLWFMVKKGILSKAAQKIADLLGGADLGNYVEKLGDISANKGSHKLRSIANQPNHKKWWKKQSKKKTPG